MPSERWEYFPSELSSHIDWPKHPSFPTLQASALVTSRKRFGYIIPMSPRTAGGWPVTPCHRLTFLRLLVFPSLLLQGSFQPGSVFIYH